MDTIPSERVVTIPSESRPGHYSISESRKRALFLVRVDQDTIPLVRVEKLFFWIGSRGHVGSLGYHGRTSLKRGTCHGDVVRGRLARTYASREGDMSWCIYILPRYRVRYRY